MLRVENDALIASVGVLESAHREMEATLTTLEREAQVLASQWQGDARLAFDTAHRSWKAQMATLSNLLNAARLALDATAETYEATERTIERGWSI